MAMKVDLKTIVIERVEINTMMNQFAQFGLAIIIIYEMNPKYL